MGLANDWKLQKKELVNMHTDTINYIIKEQRKKYWEENDKVSTTSLPVSSGLVSICLIRDQRTREEEWSRKLFLKKLKPNFHIW